MISLFKIAFKIASEPKLKVLPNGTKNWYLNGKLHREDGPAVETYDGREIWYLNDELHREDGPAMVRPNGTKEWYLNGKLHREDGPAVEYPNGKVSWYLNGHNIRELNSEEIQKKYPELYDSWVVYDVMNK